MKDLQNFYDAPVAARDQPGALALADTPAYAAGMTRPPPARLGPSDWLDAGLSALSETGPEALKAEPLAARLGVSKGSFYWHFRDVPAFHGAVLAHWETGAVTGIAADAPGEAPTAAPARLRALAQALADNPGPAGAAEAAIRGWAQGHAGARAALARVDAARLVLLQRLLSQTGIDNPEMARLIYAACIGMGGLGQIAPSDRRAAIGSLVDLVLALS